MILNDRCGFGLFVRLLAFHQTTMPLGIESLSTLGETFHDFKRPIPWLKGTKSLNVIDHLRHYFGCWPRNLYNMAKQNTSSKSLNGWFTVQRFQSSQMVTNGECSTTRPRKRVYGILLTR